MAAWPRHLKIVMIASLTSWIVRQAASQNPALALYTLFAMTLIRVLAKIVDDQPSPGRLCAAPYRLRLIRRLCCPAWPAAVPDSADGQRPLAVLTDLATTTDAPPDDSNRNA